VVEQFDEIVQGVCFLIFLVDQLPSSVDLIDLLVGG